MLAGRRDAFSANLFIALAGRSESVVNFEGVLNEICHSIKMSSSQPQAYHCICSTLILVTNHDLDQLPTRKSPAQDQAKILILQNQQSDVILQNVQADSNKIIVRREDGFEKRILLRCAQCKLTLGYQLDQSQFVGEDIEASNIAYILPGSLMSTETMMDAGKPSTPMWAQQ